MNQQGVPTNIHEDPNDVALNLSEILYSCAKSSRSTDLAEEIVVDSNLGRWHRIMNENDQQKLWQGVNWCGEIVEDLSNNDVKPADNEFKDHFDELFNPTDIPDLHIDDFNQGIYVPVLDDPIVPEECVNQTNKLKPNKGSGPDGIPPGIFKVLPVQWILLSMFY